MVISLIKLGVLLTALLHFWFFLLESFFWQKPLGLKTFKMEQEFARRSAPLAANQGVYNALLGAGLLWSLFASTPEATHLKFFFLGCVVCAGIYGGVTVNFRIFLIQALPAIVTLILLGSLFIN